MTLFYFSYLDANCSPSLPPSQHHLLAQRLRLCLGCGFGGGRRNKALRKLQLMPQFPLGHSLEGGKKSLCNTIELQKDFSLILLLHSDYWAHGFPSLERISCPDFGQQPTLCSDTERAVGSAQGASWCLSKYQSFKELKCQIITDKDDEGTGASFM